MFSYISDLITLFDSSVFILDNTFGGMRNVKVTIGNGVYDE